MPHHDANGPLPPLSLEAVLHAYGTEIPPLPGQPRMAQHTVRMATALYDKAQALANDALLPYRGDLGAVFRHGVALLHRLWELDKARGQAGEPSVAAWQAELETAAKEDTDYGAFLALVDRRLKDCATLPSSDTADVVWGLIQAARKLPTRRLRLKAQGQLVDSKRVRKLLQVNSADDRLASWWEALS